MTAAKNVMEALLPCPHCGNWNIRHCDWRIKCFNCGATGPECRDPDKRISAWNRRASLLPARDTSKLSPAGVVERCAACLRHESKCDCPDYVPSMAGDTSDIRVLRQMLAACRDPECKQAMQNSIATLLASPSATAAGDAPNWRQRWISQRVAFLQVTRGMGYEEATAEAEYEAIQAEDAVTKLAADKAALAAQESP